MNEARDRCQRVLCVDLDGTLLKTGLLQESLCRMLVQRPLSLFSAMAWLLRGKVHLRSRVLESVSVDPALLPYHTELLRFLAAEHRQGRRLVLAAGNDRQRAQPIASYLGLFEDVVVGDGGVDFSGTQRRDVLENRFGSQGFDYVGNAWSDLPVWTAAGEAIVVSQNQRLVEEARRVGNVRRVFAAGRQRWHVFARAIRVHQWVKNLLVFVAPTMAHTIFHADVLWMSIVAFVAFCLTSSSLYLFNDLVDLDADRQHRSKRYRPLAAGELSLGWGLTLVPLLLLGAVLLAMTLPSAFGLTLGAYFGLTLLYSFWLKRIPIVDILLLAGFYTLRIIAGGCATEVEVSKWLLAFSMFLFLSLACVKRYSELHHIRASQGSAGQGRGYEVEDLEMIAQSGIASGYLSVLVLALYINSDAVTALYRHESILWLICPLILYWIGRVWLLARRGQIHDDPIVFAIRDRTSYVTALLCAAIIVGAA
jgi:4-hydroxybenzoate polyprenyltransferase